MLWLGAGASHTHRVADSHDSAQQRWLTVSVRARGLLCVSVLLCVQRWFTVSVFLCCCRGGSL